MKKIIYFVFIGLLVFSQNIVLAEEVQDETIQDSATTSEEIVTEEHEVEETAPEQSEEDLQTISVEVNFRHNANLFYSDTIELIVGTTTEVTDSDGNKHDIQSDSVLAGAVISDENSDSFSISNLGYFDSFDSFIINCIEISDNEACDNWQYTVNSEYPFYGIDDYVLNDGDRVFFYFGQPRRFSVSTTTPMVNELFTVFVEEYDYENNIWNPLSESSVGATKPNPDDPWTPIVAYSETTDGTGNATFLIDTVGTYSIGLAQDFYYPSTEITVTDANSNQNDNENSSSSGGSSGGYSEPESININKAMSFLISHQSANGSFGPDLYTDWVAIALGSATGFSGEKTLLKENLIKNPISGDNLQDYTRRAMALMALGTNPHTTSEINYIEKILSYFDGSQFGDSEIFNDDIFALFPLYNAGYRDSDPEISKTIDFVLKNQSGNGSWIDIDITSAAVQALYPFSDRSDVANALLKAKTYLKSNQKNDGGFGNVFSTAWTTQAIKAFGESASDWKVGDLTAINYLASKQDSDGGFVSDLDDNSRLWATSYVIPAHYGKTWHEILKDFSKKKAEIVNSEVSPRSNSSEIDENNEELENNEMVLGESTEMTDLEAILAYIYTLTGLTGDTIIIIE